MNMNDYRDDFSQQPVRGDAGGIGGSEPVPTFTGGSVRDRPILFSAPMVRALLAGTKTQTRRVVKNINPTLPASNPEPHHIANALRCPCGVHGDRLWVREAWRVSRFADPMPPRDLSAHVAVAYEAESGSWGESEEELLGKLRPGMFMPRWASRITLEVTGVRVERLQAIHESDVMAEGLRVADCDGLGARVEFSKLWESINGPGSWAANPWVWVVEFRRTNAVAAVQERIPSGTAESEQSKT
jgi:hypothetical protein